MIVDPQGAEIATTEQPLRDETLTPRAQELADSALGGAMAAANTIPPMNSANFMRKILCAQMAINQQLAYIEARLERIEGRMAESAVWPPRTAEEVRQEDERRGHIVDQIAGEE